MNSVDELFLKKLQYFNTTVVYFHVVVGIYAVCVMLWCSRTILSTALLLRFERVDLILYNLFLCMLLFYIYVHRCTYMYNNNNNIIYILHVRDEFNRTIISNVPTYTYTAHTSPLTANMLRTIGRAVSINVSLPRL